MEFPHLGANCSFTSCNKLDFLPMKCDACQTVFCSEHFSYASHACVGARQRDVQVPECPLCGAPVPGRRGEPPDVAVGAHIDDDCRADPARVRRNKVFANRCTLGGCKGKEMVPLVCAECGRNFCFRHRHAADHACAGAAAARRSTAAEAALTRMKAPEGIAPVAATPTRGHAATFAEIQGNMTEDEALAHALSLSLQAEGAAGGGAGAGGPAGSQPRPLRARVGGEQPSRCALS